MTKIEMGTSIRIQCSRISEFETVKASRGLRKREQMQQGGLM